MKKIAALLAVMLSLSSIAVACPGEKATDDKQTMTPVPQPKTP